MYYPSSNIFKNEGIFLPFIFSKSDYIFTAKDERISRKDKLGPGKRGNIFGLENRRKKQPHQSDYFCSQFCILVI
jgi:hypothetical protein